MPAELVVILALQHVTDEVDVTAVATAAAARISAEYFLEPCAVRRVWHDSGIHQHIQEEVVCGRRVARRVGIAVMREIGVIDVVFLVVPHLVADIRRHQFVELVQIDLHAEIRRVVSSGAEQVVRPSLVNLIGNLFVIQ